ncbi:hypothetical protein KQX54_018949 [Cotesia glomerata]|uniref:Uncharacterized protein n=1 Tax=Cotesia glomerata TaxID=32391 RepID=A0AAV7IFE2_COTGL|nr:hypothetical protein KQX54_018949 [Cotesia glomerata]
MSVLLEARPYRPFKSSEEYLIAMKEDLAEWLNALYPELRVNLDNFMDRLDTGVPLCKLSCVLRFVRMCNISLVGQNATKYTLHTAYRGNNFKQIYSWLDDSRASTSSEAQCATRLSGI